MTSENQVQDRADMLLSGPRGRRMLLEYALHSELSKSPVRSRESFGYAVVMAAHPLSSATRSEVAERLNALELTEPTPALAREALAAAVDHARYWEVSEGEDVLAATPEMRTALGRVAALIAASTESRWWEESVATQSQWSVQWDGAEPKRGLSAAAAVHLPPERTEVGGRHRRGTCPRRRARFSTAVPRGYGSLKTIWAGTVRRASA